ncbi:hypothetical protein QEH53_14290 [Pelagicoccus sp. SDUM812002]|nr:hypothetical protein [Pelagicoccus sp. SDUM812002]
MSFLFSALLGLVLIVVVAVLARKEMIKQTKDSEKEKERKQSGDAESRGASDGPNQG